MKMVYIDGDSTAYGMDDQEMGGWANQLLVATFRENTSLEDATIIKNHSMPGRTLSVILREAAKNMADYRRSFGQVTAIVQTGMNEVKIHRGSRTPLVSAELFRKQVTQFCVTAREKDCTPILVGPPPIDTSRENPTFSGAIIKDKLLAEYGGIMRDVADSQNISYVDTRETFDNSGKPLRELLASDGYHPNALGHTVLAAAVSSVLQSSNQ